MQNLKRILLYIPKLLVFWIIVFDFQRILFSIHNWNEFTNVSITDWFLTFFYSIRLDLSMAGYLSILPTIALLFHFYFHTKWTKRLFFVLLSLELIFVSLIHAGEINVYPEWNHKLTSRVFMHLSNPDEVFRTADYSMTFWYILYAFLEIVFGWKMMQFFFPEEKEWKDVKLIIRLPLGIVFFMSSIVVFFLFARGGLQPIPINIDSAYFSSNLVINDLSVNSTYYFGNSFLLYNRAEIDDWMPDINNDRAKKLVSELYDFPKKHDIRILKNNRPNIVFVILESWSAEAIGCLSETKGATPYFDALAKEGILFTNLYATSSTSEIGNSSIFSGNPAIPEISISLQPEKHRKLRSLNQDFQDWGYKSGYMFSGDLKYGNIGGYFMDHGFQDVIDEDDFPKEIKRGKLNFYDEDLYSIFLQRINTSKEPFMQCAFTGSTHPPYDHPKSPKQNWKGAMPDFMNSIIYADECLHNFIENCKKEKWFKNTLFVFVADHGHLTPTADNISKNNHFRIPMLIWGEPLKDEYRGTTIDKVGSQADIAATLLTQFGGDASQYPWSKDLFNPNVKEFALHTIIRGYGWVTDKGGMTYQMDAKNYVDDTFPKNIRDEEIEKGQAFLTEIYAYYKQL